MKIEYIIIGALLIIIGIMFINGQPQHTEQTCTWKDQIFGFYDNLSGKIVIETKGLPQETVQHILLHEYGHYLFAIENGESPIADPMSEIFAEQFADEHYIAKR